MSLNDKKKHLLYCKSVYVFPIPLISYQNIVVLLHTMIQNITCLKLFLHFFPINAVKRQICSCSEREVKESDIG